MTSIEERGSPSLQPETSPLFVEDVPSRMDSSSMAIIARLKLSTAFAVAFSILGAVSTVILAIFLSQALVPTGYEASDGCVYTKKIVVEIRDLALEMYRCALWHNDFFSYEIPLGDATTWPYADFSSLGGCYWDLTTLPLSSNNDFKKLEKLSQLILKAFNDSDLKTTEKLRLRWIQNEVILLLKLIESGHFFSSTADYWVDSSWYNDPILDSSRTAQLLTNADFTYETNYNSVVIGWLKNYSVFLPLWKKLMERAVDEGKVHSDIVMKFQSKNYLSALDVDFSLVCNTFSIDSDKETCLNYTNIINSESSLYKSYFQGTYLPSCAKLRPDEKSGLSFVPRGNEIYQAWIEYHLGETITANEIYELGKKRLQTNKEAILTTIHKIDPSITTFEQAAISLANPNDSRWFICNNDSSVVQNYVRILMAQIEDNLRPEFGYFSGARVEVTVTGTSSTYSSMGNYDHKRNFWLESPVYNIGRYEFCGSNESKQYYFDKLQISTVAHEAMPGHGHQLQLEAEVDCGIGYPYAISPTLHCEGWGLYSESELFRIGTETFGDKGLLTEQENELSYHIAMIMRNARLIVDAGIHGAANLSWTNCVQEMVSDSFSQYLSEVECERYIQMPGQAVAYMMGFIAVDQLRNTTENALGNLFDPSEFHNIILRWGGMNFVDLQSLVNTYIQFKKAIQGDSSSDNLKSLNKLFGIDIIKSDMFSRARPTVGVGRKVNYDKTNLQQNRNYNKRIEVIQKAKQQQRKMLFQTRHGHNSMDNAKPFGRDHSFINTISNGN